MSRPSPEEDCNCDDKMFVPSKTIENLWRCTHCGSRWTQIVDGADDFEWVAIDE